MAASVRRVSSVLALAGTFVVGAWLAPALAQSPSASQPFTVEDLVRLKRVSDPEVSPDGHYVAFVLRETDMAANKGRTALWLLDLAREHALPQRLTSSAGSDSSPRWGPDGRTIYFLSTRGGSSQVWRLALQGGEATRVTDYPLDVGSLKVSPRGDRTRQADGFTSSCSCGTGTPGAMEPDPMCSRRVS
jgi:dipeptidyl aminopeptidase/acylaminoacyl peptidase